MDIDRCNSIFELLTAFNFTYALVSEINDSEQNNEESDGNLSIVSSVAHSFVDVIENKLFRTHIIYEKQAKKLFYKITNFKNSIDERLLRNGIPKQQKTDLNRVRLDVINIEGKCNSFINEMVVARNDRKVEINTRFPYMSFFSAIFCILILGVSASEDATIKHMSLFIFLVFSTLIYIAIWLQKIYNSFYHIAKWLLGSFFIVVFIHLILKLIYKEPTSIPFVINIWHEFVVIKVILILWALSLPLFHFMFYFRKIFIDGEKFESEWKKSIAEINTGLATQKHTFNSL